MDARGRWAVVYVDDHDHVDGSGFDHDVDDRANIDVDVDLDLDIDIIVFVDQFNDRAIGGYNNDRGPIAGRGEQRISGPRAGAHRLVAAAYGDVGDPAARLRSDCHLVREASAIRSAQETMTVLATLGPWAPPEPVSTIDAWRPESESFTEQGWAVPPLSPRMQLVRAPIVVLLVLSAILLIQFVLISSSQESAAQQSAFDSFRSQLARGTAPIGPSDSQGRELALGASVAYVEIPDIGVKQVVGEGTTPGALFNGPGHRRDTPLPGQVGTSVLFGRRAAFGGPFARIDELKKGDLIKVTTGQGVFNFHVLGVRKKGDPVPVVLASGAGRVVLTTAAGAPFLPNGVLRVDADLDGTAVVGPPRLVGFAGLPAEERLMASDERTLWVLALWLQALIVLSLGLVWVWHRWGRAQAWVIFLPALMLAGLFASGEAARLLPNLL